MSPRVHSRWLLLATIIGAIALVLSAVLAMSGDAPRVSAVGENSITAPDTVAGDGIVGRYSSMALDASGFPVISYKGANPDVLKLMHCNDANCDPSPGPPGNGPESIQSFELFSRGSTSLRLDTAVGREGFPVIAVGNPIQIVHCNDVNCADGGESITTPALDGTNPSEPSLVLDANHNPAVAYRTSGIHIGVLRCNDANCAGADESVELLGGAASGIQRQSPSLQLDGPVVPGGPQNPVIAFQRTDPGGGSDLLIAHCNDANCAGGDIPVESPDSVEAPGTPNFRTQLSRLLPVAGPRHRRQPRGQLRR